MITILDLFSGIGGFSYAAEQLVGGFKVKQFVEIDSKCHKVLKKHWPDVPIHGDISTFTAPVGSYDVITAGFPCQDLSSAGKQLGFSGERSSLFYEIIRLAREIRPKFILLENVANIVSHSNGETFQEVLFQIAKAGYDAEWAVVSAKDVGACHRRDRWWCIAYASSCERFRQSDKHNPKTTLDIKSRDNIDRLGVDGISSLNAKFACKSGNSTTENPLHSGYRLDATISPKCGKINPIEVDVSDRGNSWTQQRLTWGTGGKSLNPDWRTYVSEPCLRRGDDGLSGRVDRIKQLGNSIVPQVAAIPLTRIKELYNQHVH